MSGDTGAPPPETVWHGLEASVLTGAEALARRKLNRIRKEFAKRLQRLADLNMVDPQAMRWLDRRARRSRYRGLILSEHAPRDGAGRRVIPIDELAHLEDGAGLTIRVLIGGKGTMPAAYTIGLDGTLRSGGRRWHARLDLAGTGEGQGKASHAILHTHVGHVPGVGVPTRVPTPWLDPWDALDWLLATADPRFEPCPHP